LLCGCKKAGTTRGSAEGVAAQVERDSSREAIMPRLPALLDKVAETASNYRITRFERGYALWRFRAWSHRSSGWRIVAQHGTKDAAEQDLAHRLDLEPEAPKPTVIMACIVYAGPDPGDYWGWA
jgi:uncharacterized protein YbdZ (MbtH family)